MAGRTAVLAVRIIGDATDAQRAFDSTARGSDRMQRGLDKASVAATGVIGAVGAMAKASFDSASALQQASGAVEATFGAQAAAVDRLAATAADRVGLATSQYSNLAAVLGAQMKNAGTAADQLAPSTERLISLGADLAAQYGGSTADAVAAVSSLLRGERDPIERYAVSINQAAIDSYLLAHGQGELEGAALRNAQAQATLALLTEQTASAHGAFAREADTAAGAQQRASAQWENAKAKLGEALLPVVSAGATKLAELSGVVSRNAGTFRSLAAVLGAAALVVLTINGAMRAYRATVAAVTVVQKIFNIAARANPIGLIVTGVLLAIGVVTTLYHKFDSVRRIIDRVVSAGKSVGRFIGGLFSAPAAPAGPLGPAAVGRAYGAAAYGAGTYGATGSLAAAVGGSSTGTAAPAARGGDVINITINDAYDPERVADRLRGVLDNRDRQLGRRGAVAFGLPR